MTDALPIAVAVLVIVFVVGLAAFQVGYQRGQARQAQFQGPALHQLYDELADLRHIQQQLLHPPVPHEHVWPREPDVRKKTWLRYRCAYKDCPQIRWVPR